MTDNIETRLYSAAQVREFDRRAIEDHGISGIQLMKRAGRAAFERLLEYWPSPQKITVFCGSGNNAGDGYVIAALACARCIPAQVVQVGDPEKLKGDALLAYRYAISEGVVCLPYSDCPNLDASLDEGVIVDALLGTGLDSNVREPFAAAIQRINLSELPVLAVDIPSGLCSNTGAERGVAVHADAVISFIALKQGLFTGRGVALCGDVVFDDLGVPADVRQKSEPLAELMTLPELLAQLLPPRKRDAHKGDFGHVMIIGGDKGMGGAAAMAAEAALRSGAGLVSVATRPEHLAAILSRRPELMVSGVISGQELEPLLDRPTVLVVGPGLGSSPWSEQMLQQALKTDLPMVLDADALNILASGRLSLTDKQRNLIVTPHPGEAARLLGCNTKDIQNDRFEAIRKLHKRYGAMTVLKGAGSLIYDGNNPVAVCGSGNPGMASGGMGDVLSGIVGALLAQGVNTSQAARLGVGLHAMAADQAANASGERGLLATDLFAPLQRLVNL